MAQAVEVYPNLAVFPDKTKKVPNTTAVSRVGDQALIASGFSSSTRGAS